MTPLESNSRPALAPGVRLQIDKLNDEAVLLYPEGVLELNGTAHEIVNLCNGVTTLDEIVAALSAEYEVEQSVLRVDVLECLVDLQQRRLIVIK